MGGGKVGFVERSLGEEKTEKERRGLRVFENIIYSKERGFSMLRSTRRSNKAGRKKGGRGGEGGGLRATESS